MTGVNYASGKVLGTTNAGNVQASLTTGDDSTVQPTAISSSYVATDVSDIVDEVMPSIVAIKCKPDRVSEFLGTIQDL